MELAEKLKAIRIGEGLTQTQLCEATGINLSTYKKYELSLRTEISSIALLRITNNPRFKKYTLWLMTDEIAPACGQVSPRSDPA